MKAATRPPIPYEHGAWGMLYIPFLSAILCAGVFNQSVIPCFLVLTLAFLLQQPLLAGIRMFPSRRMNPERFRFLCGWSVIYGILLLICFALLYARSARPQIFIFVISGCAIFLAHLQLKTERLDRKIAGELISVLGLTLSAPFTWFVLTGRLDRFCFGLWGFNVLYFTSSLFYVRLRVTRAIKKRDPKPVMRQCAVYHVGIFLLLAFAALRQIVSPYVLLAFVPILFRAAWAIASRPTTLNLKRIGWTEVALSIVFVILLSFGLRA